MAISTIEWSYCKWQTGTVRPRRKKKQFAKALNDLSIRLKETSLKFT